MFVKEGEDLPPEILAKISEFDEAVNNDSYSVDFSELDSFFGLNGEEVSLDSAMGEDTEEDITAELIENTFVKSLEEGLFAEEEVELSELDYSSLTNEFPVISMPDVSMLNKITEDDVMIDEEEKTEAEEDEDISEYFSAFEENDEDTKAGPEDSSRKAVNWVFDFLEIFAVCITCIIVVFAYRNENFFKFVCRIIGELNEGVESRFKTRIGLKKLFHRRCVTCNDNNKVIAVIFQRFCQLGETFSSV